MDALSQLNAVDCGTTSKEYHRDDLLRGLEQEYKKEKKTKEILENLDEQKDFCVIQNKLYYTRTGRMQLYLPPGQYWDLILWECHDTRYAGYLGVRKTIKPIQRDFY